MSSDDGRKSEPGDLSRLLDRSVSSRSLIAGRSGLQHNGKPGRTLLDQLQSLTVPARWPDVDPEKFRFLCMGSISLTVGEKRGILEAFPILSRAQVVGLIKIWEDERTALATMRKELN